MTDILLQFNTESYSLYHSDDFIVKEISNLTWGQNDLSLTSSPYLAGDTVQNNVGVARDITITLKPTEGKGDFGAIIHQFARMQGQEVTLLWKDRKFKSFTYYNGDPHTEENLYDDLECDIVISGVVNEFEVNRFTNNVELEFNVHCSNPYWQSTVPIWGSTYTSDLLESICNYSEVLTGFSLEINNFALSATSIIGDNQYSIRIDADNYTETESNVLTVDIYSLNGSAVSANYFKINFEKGKTEILMGDDEATATDARKRIGWKVIRYKYEDGNFQGYTVAEFPHFPLSKKAEGIAFSASKINNGSGTNVVVTLSYYPCFL